jgi:hypothetical protein
MLVLGGGGLDAGGDGQVQPGADVLRRKPNGRVINSLRPNKSA